MNSRFKSAASRILKGRKEIPFFLTLLPMELDPGWTKFPTSNTRQHRQNDERKRGGSLFAFALESLATTTMTRNGSILGLDE